MDMHAMRGAAAASAVTVCGFLGLVMVQAAPSLAQTAPSFAQAPSFGQALGNETLDGVVVRFVPRTPYELGLRDDQGYLDTVRLHDKTLMFPIGFRLRLGMRVRILGFNGGNAFTANEIDRALPPRLAPVLREPSWYGEWDGTGRMTATAGSRHPSAPAFVNPPAPAFVNPPAPP
jgi:hypothetical protein